MQAGFLGLFLHGKAVDATPEAMISRGVVQRGMRWVSEE